MTSTHALCQPTSGEQTRRRRWRSFLASLLLTLALPLAASAYTLVLRNGRRVIIPDQFRATETAIVYEAAPGITVTVQLATVDTTATEQANGEAAGDFLKKVQQLRTTGTPARPAAPAAARHRVLTNQDLEASRLKREAADAEYERTRRERNLLSREELRRQAEEQDRQLEELSRQVEAAQAAAREEALRSELSLANQQLNQLRNQSYQQPVAPQVYAVPYPYAYSYPSTYYYPYSYSSPLITVGVGGVNRQPFFRHELRRPHPFPQNGWSFRFRTGDPRFSRDRERPPQALVPAPRMLAPRR